MGAMFIGQQFLQNVLGYTTFQSGAAILPGAICMVLVAPRSAKLVDKQGARLTMLTGYVFVLLGFLTMLPLLGRGHALLGRGTWLWLYGHRRRVRRDTSLAFPHRLAVPVTRVGMASGTGRSPT